MASADAICRIPYKGAEYELHPRDITVGRLRAAQGWYGKDYGKYATLMTLFFQGDADAVAVVLWIVLAKNGITREPQNIDFSPFDIYEAINKANDEKEKELREQAASDADDDAATESADPTPQPVDETIRDGELT